MTLEERIVEAASQMFAHKGIKAVSMDQIAQHVGISKRTLYETYSSKDELLVRCLQRNQELHEAEMNQKLASTNDFVEILIYMMADVVKQIHSINPLFYHEMSRYHYLAADQTYALAQSKKRRGLLELLRRGIDEGYVLPHIDLDITADIFLSQHLIHTPDIQRRGVSIDKVFRAVFVTFFRGICTIKGCQRFDNLLDESVFEENNNIDNTNTEQ